MRDRLRSIQQRFELLAEQMADPQVLGRPSEYQKIAKEYSELQRVVNLIRQYDKAALELAQAKELAETAEEADLKQMAVQEAGVLTERHRRFEQELKLSLIEFIASIISWRGLGTDLLLLSFSGTDSFLIFCSYLTFQTLCFIFEAISPRSYFGCFGSQSNPCRPSFCQRGRICTTNVPEGLSSVIPDIKRILVPCAFTASKTTLLTIEAVENR